MSVVFEGVIFLGRENCDELVPGFDGNDIAFEKLGNIAVAFRKGPRSTALFSEKMKQLASSISVKCDIACLLRIDTRVGYRESQFYVRGEIGPHNHWK